MIVMDGALILSIISTIWGQSNLPPRYSGVVKRARLSTRPARLLLLIKSRKPVTTSRFTLRAENKLEKQSRLRP